MFQKRVTIDNSINLCIKNYQIIYSDTNIYFSSIKEFKCIFVVILCSKMFLPISPAPKHLTVAFPANTNCAGNATTNIRTKREAEPLLAPLTFVESTSTTPTAKYTTQWPHPKHFLMYIRIRKMKGALPPRPRVNEVPTYNLLTL